MFHSYFIRLNLTQVTGLLHKVSMNLLAVLSCTTALGCHRAFIQPKGGYYRGNRTVAELVEEPVSRTPPHLEPIVPNLGNRLKIKRFTCVWSHVRISVWYVLTIGSGLALMNRVNCSQSRDFR